ncbi:hypothetical protein DFJ74DRAFT_669209 [Hyaloraphidium curvatum]|nr:hypothetical protein DFJ74DRAFT_669209 [Hyaloraphidium curvatum]
MALARLMRVCRSLRASASPALATLGRVLGEARICKGRLVRVCGSTGLDRLSHLNLSPLFSADIKTLRMFAGYAGCDENLDKVLGVLLRDCVEFEFHSRREFHDAVQADVFRRVQRAIDGVVSLTKLELLFGNDETRFELRSVPPGVTQVCVGQDLRAHGTGMEQFLDLLAGIPTVATIEVDARNDSAMLHRLRRPQVVTRIKTYHVFVAEWGGLSQIAGFAPVTLVVHLATADGKRAFFSPETFWWKVARLPSLENLVFVGAGTSVLVGAGTFILVHADLRSNLKRIVLDRPRPDLPVNDFADIRGTFSADCAPTVQIRVREGEWFGQGPKVERELKFWRSLGADVHPVLKWDDLPAEYGTWSPL